MTGPELGCIADDFTGGTDVAAALRRAGLRTALLFGAPAPDDPLPACDAAVVAVKSRTIPAPEAVAVSLDVQRWLAARGARRLYFKYCSTFDSTDAGNIGPVADALLDAAGATTSRSSARRRPSTAARPTGPPLRRRRPALRLADAPPPAHADDRREPGSGAGPPDPAPGRAAGPGHGPRRCPRRVRSARGARRHGRAPRRGRCRLGHDLDVVAAAAGTMTVLTGGAGLARAVGAAAVARTPGHRQPRAPTCRPAPASSSPAAAPPPPSTKSPSMARATFLLPPRPGPTRHPRTPDELLAGGDGGLERHLGTGRCSSTPPLPAERDAACRRETGAEDRRRPRADARPSRPHRLVDRGVRRIVVAGGETSGAVVSALGVAVGCSSPRGGPGVPWIVTSEPAPWGSCSNPATSEPVS